ncbi:GNAT family N-acetyltransferase [Lactobacillus gasseri]|uniref:GNAT family N-acetyltransferase n=2 Tax=Lactobacillus TaxID=1578 RepID=A0A833FHK1_LACGS|nr:GNAT family N-acetyltransferase [Lactobacillus gasseri]EFQ46448.1 putative toxin-antitoxin system, toxin component, GNAT family [Lactobacillus gasseri MV-22]EJN54955.1 Toxin-antitoxin system, toxin component, GNAT family [Lactobacillus gasseri CECT 5714]KAB1920211.1 GNAT family N-acetyltransferase [Lactobacillus gasseri ATCC 33323 = JCM 1131]KAB1951691.1 GNAT family N-acetyltransferase [Lactobacillus gasseri]MBO1898844.1 GNAT family N-acetyltransferase [Lactobacillus gasseri]
MRKFQETDFDDLCVIHDQARKQELKAAFKPLKIAAIEEDLFSYNIYVAAIDEKIVAFVAFSDDELAWLYVDPSFQKQGIGSKLIEFSLTKMKRPTYLEVLTGNPAKSLYLHKGFKFLQHESGKMPGNETFHVEVDLLIYK